MGSNATWGAMFQSVASKVKAAYLNVTDTELKVLDATNEEPWGPHGSVMAEIARLAERPDQYNEVMGILHQRLQERDERWRMCYKALLLLEYLCKQGPLRVASDLSRSVHILESLRDMFEYKDLQGRDHGVNVRQRAKELVMLVNSPQRLQEEREKAQKNAGKYRGVSATEMRVGGYGGGGGGGGYGTGGSHSGSGYGSGGGGGGGGYGSSSFGSGQDGAGPSYGRAQSEMSSHRRHGSGQSAPAGTEEGDDPFEATRKRIERLKADGTIAEPPREPPSQGISGTLVDPVPTDKKGPKKLSDVKIDPKFATTIASLAPPPTQRTAPVVALPPPPGSRAALGLAKPSSQGGGAPAVPPASTSNSALDLLGDLTLPTPAPAPGLAPPPASKGAAAGLGFAAAPAPAARAPGGDGFDMLAGFGGSSAAAPAAAPKPPAAASPFDDLLFGPSTTAPAPAPAGPKPAAFPAPAPASAADPFAVLAAAAAPKVAAPSGFDALLTPSAVPAPAQPLAPAPAFAAARPPLDDFFAAPTTTTTTTAATAAPASTPDPFAHMLGGSGLAGNGGGFGAPAAAPAPGLALGGVGAPMVPKPMTGAPPPPSMASKDPFAGLGF